jgi:hypothetical protein
MTKKFTTEEAVKHLISSKNLLLPGSKFIVTSSLCTAFTNGTVGFMSYVKNLDGGLNTLVGCRAAVVRRGKTGKDRIDNAHLIMPLIDSHELAPDGIKRYLVPTPQTKVKYFVQVEQIKPYKYSLMDMPAHDFLGWALSMASHFYNLTHSFANRGVSVWPQSKDDILNRLHRNLVNYFGENPTQCYDNFTSPKAREDIIDKLRKLGTMTIRAELLQRNHIIELKRHAISAASNIYSSNDKKLFSKVAVTKALKKLEEALYKNAEKMGHIKKKAPQYYSSKKPY